MRAILQSARKQKHLSLATRSTKSCLEANSQLKLISFLSTQINESSLPGITEKFDVDKQLTVREDELYKVFWRLNNAFKVRGTISSDSILEDLKIIIDMGQVVPVSFLMDAATVFAKRHDVLRVELLIRLCSGNLLKQENVHNQIEDDKKYNLYSPKRNFIAHCINEVMRFGNLNDSLELWVRMSNSGHITSKFEMKTMIESLKIHRPNDKVEIKFVNKLHKKMTENIWDQSYEYYYEILLVYKHYIIHDSFDYESIVKYCNEYDDAWDSFKLLNKNGDHILDDKNVYEMSHLSKNELEIYAIDMDCWLKVCTCLYKYLNGCVNL